MDLHSAPSEGREWIRELRNPIVVALDLSSASEALRLAEQLRGTVGMFKVGKQLFTAAGPDIVRQLLALGERVFLDLKYHDIPNTVARAGVEAARLGVSIFNLHALGGLEMMRATAEAVGEACQRESRPRPLLLGVTVLTSHTRETLSEIGIDQPVEEEVIRLARLCDAAGIDGVVASPQEILPLRQAIPSPDFCLLTPGVRPTGAALHDQRRVMTPGEAIIAGASFLVIGRPITEAADPVAAAQAIADEIKVAYQTHPTRKLVQPSSIPSSPLIGEEAKEIEREPSQ
jgi:orotidine-5'-phosphate decarboxylase